MLWRALDYADIARFCNASGAHATTIDACRIGLSIAPDDAMLHVYRAAAYDELGQGTEAVADCEAAVRLDPRGHAAVLALITLALVRERAGDAAGALAAAGAALAISPADHEAHALLGTLRAWHGDYPAAWPELECHWLDERLQFMRRFPGLPEWDGEALAGQRVLVVHGQGTGDMLQMVRYLPRLRERGAHVLLECPPALIDLMHTVAGIDETLLSGTATPDRFDRFARLMTLPRLCGETGAPAACVPYIRADPARITAWAPRLSPAAGSLRAGLAWAGNPAHPNDRRRSIPLEALAPLATVPGVRWFSLQAGPHAGDAPPAGMALTRLDTQIADWSDTAAIVAQLDLVISADTAVAHLAGAMGVPVWLLLPWRPDWRWSPAGEGTPWYPTMRLFHAREPSWTTAVADVATQLPALTVR
jgi:hypothetical protein